MESDNNEMQRGVSQVLKNQGCAETNSNGRHDNAEQNNNERQRKMRVYLASLVALATISAVLYLANQNRIMHKKLDQYNEFQSMSAQGQYDALEDQLQKLKGIVRRQSQKTKKFAVSAETFKQSDTSAKRMRLFISSGSRCETILLGILNNNPDKFSGLPPFVNWQDPDYFIKAMIEFNSENCLSWVMQQSEWYSCLSIKSYIDVCNWIDTNWIDTNLPENRMELYEEAVKEYAK